MPSEPHWLDARVLGFLNAEIVAATGEPHLVLDVGLLESAANRPINLWAYQGETDIVALGVALLFGVARNHAFQQGNKRTAWAAFIAFAKLNGAPAAVDDTEAIAQAIVDVITGEHDETWFVDLIRSQVRSG